MKEKRLSKVVEINLVGRCVVERDQGLRLRRGKADDPWPRQQREDDALSCDRELRGLNWLTPAEMISEVLLLLSPGPELNIFVTCGGFTVSGMKLHGRHDSDVRSGLTDLLQVHLKKRKILF